MEDIIAPIDKSSKIGTDGRQTLKIYEQEQQQIYIVTWKNAPNVLKEIGRLRGNCIPCRWRGNR